ncbi:MAG: excinuclease ABC subunit UvrA [Chlorobi bacterium]|nr:excinuclease ABC subunit UvrA [Chlorobiota bacterium]
MTDKIFEFGAIEVINARTHNLKNVNVKIPRYKLIAVTGVSGSGKTSLAIDTIYAEGHRRYTESLSTYARQFFQRIQGPDVDDIKGLSPAIVLQQKNPSHNPRSIVGTATEIYDFLRTLYARVSTIIDPETGVEVKPWTPDQVVDYLLENLDPTDYLLIGFPLPQSWYFLNPDELRQKGIRRLLINETLHTIQRNEEIIKQFGYAEKIYAIIDRVPFDNPSESRERLLNSIRASFDIAEKTIVIYKDKLLFFSKHRETLTKHYPPPSEDLFSFTSPQGACPECNGFGNILVLDKQKIFDYSKSLLEGAIRPWRWQYYHLLEDMIWFAERKGIDIRKPFGQLSEEEQNLIWYGDFTEGIMGVKEFFENLESVRYDVSARVTLAKYRTAVSCPSCNGARLRPEALVYKIHGYSISDLLKLSIEDLHELIKSWKFPPEQEKLVRVIREEIVSRTQHLLDLGLGYLTLDRETRTLSGGEMQRIQLARFMKSSLIHTLFVLDEPSVGLHPADTNRLIKALHRLRDLRNTIIVVEHDQDVIESADYVIEMGPGSGRNGGQIVFTGTVDELKQSETSLTGKYLSGKLSIGKIIPEIDGEPQGFFHIKGASLNNLKNIDVDIPYGRITVISGVSGSGKTSLVKGLLYPALLGEMPDELEGFEISGDIPDFQVELMDQGFTYKSRRSSPVTYIKVFDKIRKLFASTPQARQQGIKESYFSPNTAGGRCETCQGEGFIKVEMQFLADVELVCEDCNGTGFQQFILDIKLNGKNIHEVLNMTIDEAIEFFAGEEDIIKPLKTIQQVGLGYLLLGQSLTTLSAGEAQRLRMARYLNVVKQKPTVLIFDEPTIGLHPADIEKLLNAWKTLIERNPNVTIIVIEHNLDVIWNAHWMIELGPGSGPKGGKVIFTDKPEESIENPNSVTGKYLAKHMKRLQKAEA